MGTQHTIEGCYSRGTRNLKGGLFVPTGGAPKSNSIWWNSSHRIREAWGMKTNGN